MGSDNICMKRMTKDLCKTNRVDPCIWTDGSCHSTQCVGPQKNIRPQPVPEGGYDTNCGDGALATAKVWINACDTYIQQGVSGRTPDWRVKHGGQTQSIYDVSYCYTRCPVAIGLAHAESQYCPTAISPDWGSATPTQSGRTLSLPFSDGSGVDYGGGYGLWQLDGRNDHVQKNFVEYIENENSGWYDTYNKAPAFGNVTGFFYEDRREKFFKKATAYKKLTPEKQAHWILDQTTSSWFDVKTTPITKPGENWSMLKTCADDEKTHNEAKRWIDNTENPDGSPYKIASTIGVKVCTKAMKLLHKDIPINNPNKWFDYKHCIK